MKKFCTLTLVFLIAACTPADDAADDQAALEDTTPAAATPSGTATQLGEPEILHVVITANTLDTQGGEMARTKARNPEVRQFAETMVRDHTAANEQLNQLAQRTGVSPAENPTSQQLTRDHEQATSELEGKSGADFDRAYIAHEIAVHQQVLNSLDQQLIPNAQNQELRQQLQQIRQVIERHLQRAQEIQRNLGQGQ